MTTTLLEFKNVSKAFELGKQVIRILDGLSFAVREGESLALVGPSGSGKTTLLSLAAGLDLPDEGEIHLCSKNLSSLTENKKTALRATSIGFVFQNFELIPTLTALQNVMVPAELLGNHEAETEAKEILQAVGLAERAHHLPSELSGGERQRISIARAFMNQPRVLFADEPTGNLDRRSAASVVDLLFRLNEEHNTALLIATHDRELARRCERILEFDNEGHLQEVQSAA